MIRLGYLAGMIDGDGCFNITRCRKSYVPRIVVVNTDEQLITELKEHFGGTVVKTVVKNKPTWKPRFSWTLSGSRALDLADKLYRQLIIKKDQALLFRTWLAFRKVVPQHKRDIEVHQYFVDELHKLNKKGIENALTKRL